MNQLQLSLEYGQILLTNGISTGNLQTIGVEDWVLRKGAKSSTAAYMLVPGSLVVLFLHLHA